VEPPCAAAKSSSSMALSTKATKKLPNPVFQWGSTLTTWDGKLLLTSRVLAKRTAYMGGLFVVIS
jgi:hypothetical protein